MENPLIPGLPDDLASLCLARMPRLQHALLSQVCRGWRQLFHSREVFCLRAKMGMQDPWLLVLCSPSSFYAYDLRSKKRCRLPLPSRGERVQQLHSSGYNCAAIGSSFVVLGGLVRDASGLTIQPTVNIFDTITRQWSRGADMQVARCNFASGFIDGKLYVAGGYNASGDVESSAEAYDPGTDEWAFVAPMPFGLANTESDAVFEGGLYIKGRAMSAGDGERKVLSYNPVKNTWEKSEELEVGLMDGEFVATEQGLFVMNRSNYVGKYNVETARWEQVGNLSCYYFPFESPKKRGICFGKEVFFLDSLAGECMQLHQCNQVHQVLPKVFWQWQGAIIQA